MKLYRLIGAGLVSAALMAPAAAQSKDPADPFAALEEQLRELDPKLLYGRTFSEADVEQVFAWMRASIAAAAQGREAPPVPEALQQKADILSRELAARGALAGLAALNALEDAARRALRDAQKPPPPAPLPGSI